jgi:hypothetical protein
LKDDYYKSSPNYHQPPNSYPNQHHNYQNYKQQSPKKDTYDSLIIIQNNNNNNNLNEMFTPEEILSFLEENKDLSLNDMRHPDFGRKIESYFYKDKQDIDKYLKSGKALNLSK